MGIQDRTTKMFGLLVMFLAGAWASPMHMKPPIGKAVCDNPSFLIDRETSWCYMAGLQGPCRAGEIFVSSGDGNIGKCKNKRQEIIALGKLVCSDGSSLLESETGLCYPVDTQGPCRVGELFVQSEEQLGVGKCKNMRQIIIPLFPFRHFYVF